MATIPNTAASVTQTGSFSLVMALVLTILVVTGVVVGVAVRRRAADVADVVSVEHDGAASQAPGPLDSVVVIADNDTDGAVAAAHPQQLASSYFGPAEAERLREYRRGILVQNHFLPLSAWETRCCEWDPLLRV